MPFSTREITDDEYVEHVRSSVAQRPRYGWGFLLLALLLLGIQLYLGRLAAKTMLTPHTEAAFFLLGVALGIGFGLGAAIIIYHVVRYLRNRVDIRAGLRTQRLLVHYYDQLQKLSGEKRELNTGATEVTAPSK